MNDRKVVLLVVWIIGAITLAALTGMVTLLLLDKPIGPLDNITSAGLAAVATLLASTRSSVEPPSPPALPLPPTPPPYVPPPGE